MKNLHMVFINIEKAHDRVPRDLIWWVLNMSVQIGYIEIFKDMYEGAEKCVRTAYGGTCEFPVIIVLH